MKLFRYHSHSFRHLLFSMTFRNAGKRKNEEKEGTILLGALASSASMLRQLL
jgi:hypothetical protein